VDRQCSRPGCAEPAAATLTFVYARGAAWLDPLTPERDPHAYDLCDRHAARVGVPVGWRLEDRRSLVVVGWPGEPGMAGLPAPAPHDLVSGEPRRLAG
jgi:hypothetical protein